MRLPVFDNRDGRTVIGYAEGIRSATVLLRRTLNVPSGFTLYVWRRNACMMDTLDLPDGYCYSLAYSY